MSQDQDNNRVAILNNSDPASNLSCTVQIQRDARAGHGLDRVPARKAILQKLAELDQRERRRGELKSAIAVIDAESDKAVVAHAKATGPLQRELKSIEDKLVEALVTGSKAGNTKLETRRAAIIDGLAEANGQLEIVSDACKQKRGLLERELSSASLATNARGALKRGLMKHGDPVLLDQHALATSTLAWANARLTAAKRGQFESQGVERRARAWTLELAEAEKLKVEAEQAVESIYQEIIAG